jgi:Glycine zipper 2TM domain
LKLDRQTKEENDMRKTILTLSALIMATPVFMIPATPAFAHGGYKYREWRGDDGRYYCRKRNGTVGLVVGGAGGALLGRAVDTRGSRATGTILGAAAGALIGRELARKRSCR